MRDFFFTFPDGSLDFDCAACGGACCRGHGFGGARNPALADFLRAHPSLDLIVDRADRDDVNLATTRTGCPLQDADGRCTYHLERGLEAKPTICKLFPFNLVRQIGETLFIAPHHLCPFELVVPPAPGEVQGSHRELRRMLGAMESEIVSMRKDLPLPLDAVAAVRRERSFLGYAASRLGVSSFWETLVSSPGYGAESATLADRASRLLGIEGCGRHPAFAANVEAALHVLASGLRMEMLHLREQAVLAALMVTTRVVHTVLGEWRGAAPTLQTVNDVAWAQQRPIRLLVGWDELPRGEGVVLKIPDDLDAEQSLDLGLMIKVFNRGPGSWEDLSQIVEGRSRYLTISLLKDLARLIKA